MQSKLKLINSNQVWDIKRRYKLNETCSFNNINYQNITGSNSQPGIGFDWIMINSLSYKVFTFLINQTGGSSINSMSSGLLSIGVTYYIDNAVGDFTNVGAPNNNFGTYFIATGTTPNVWTGGNLNYDSGAPFITNFENTIGNVWFNFNSNGEYYLNSNNLFNINKTFFPVRTGFAQLADTSVKFGIYSLDQNTIVLQTVNSSDVLDNDIFYKTPIEIRVYS